jgi:hypothetical protein
MTMVQAEAEIAADGSVTLTRPLPKWIKPGKVQMTLMVDEQTGSAEERLSRRRQALAKLRAADPFRDVVDPAAWQHELRRDRAMPARA